MKTSNRSIFLNILVSYFLVSLIPLLVLTGVLYYYIVIESQNKLKYESTNKLTQVKNLVDFDIRKLQDVSYHMSTKVIDDKFASDDPNSMANIVAQLYGYKEDCKFTEDIMYYIRGDKNIYTFNDMFYYSTYETNSWDALDFTMVGFVSSLNQVLTTATSVIKFKEGDAGNSSNMVALFYPIPYLSYLAEERPEGVLVFFVPQKYFLDKFSKYFGDFDGYTYIFDEYYNIVASTQRGMDDDDIERIESELKKIDDGVIDLNIDGVDYTIIKVESDSKEAGQTDIRWTYVVAMPPSQYLADIYLMRNIVIMIVVSTLFIGIILAYAISKKRYSPIKSIISKLSSKDPIIDNKRFNEFEVIQTALDRVYDRNSLLAVQVDNQRPFIKDQCLLKIIGDINYDEDELDYLINCSNLDLAGYEYFIMVLSIKSDEFYQTNKIAMIATLVEVLYLPSARGYGVELVENLRIAIIVCLTSENNTVKLQRKIANAINQMIIDNFQFRVDIGIGGICKSVSDLNKSFHEAAAVLNNCYISNNSKLYVYTEMDNENNQIHWHSIKEQSLFLQSLKSGDKEVALHAFNTMMDNISNQGNSYLMVKCICFDIINNIIRYINQTNIEGFSSQIKHILEFKSIDEFVSSMNSFVFEFCDTIDKLRANHNNILRNNIIEHVKDNYKSADISLESIAGKFDITTTYLSRFFKDETGVNYLEYVTHLRMDEVKRQLRTTAQSIKTIMTSVGYIDTASFARKFKSIEGLTPGQYRQINKV